MRHCCFCSVGFPLSSNATVERIGGAEFRAPVLIVQPRRTNASSILLHKKTTDSVTQGVERETSTAAGQRTRAAVEADVTTPHDLLVPLNGVSTHV